MFLKNLWISLLVGLCLLIPTAARIRGFNSKAVASSAEGDELVEHADDFDEDDEVELHRNLKWTEPNWWDALSEAFTGSHSLDKCSKHTKPPSDGTRCGIEPIICFFGNMKCNESPAPDTTCFCNDDVWACEEYLCPSEVQRGPLETLQDPLEGQNDSSEILQNNRSEILQNDPVEILQNDPVEILQNDPVERQRVPSKGKRTPSKGKNDPPQVQPDPSEGQSEPLPVQPVQVQPDPSEEEPHPSCLEDITNPSQCPTNRPEGTCDPAAVDRAIKCEWDKEMCNGECYPSYQCSCHENFGLPNTGTWRCFYTDACM